MKAGRLILIVLLAAVLAAAAALTYRRWPGHKKEVKPELVHSAKPELRPSVPPFSTKEPDRYQATRITTSIDSDRGQVPSITRTLIAREGDKRREDYDSDTDFRTTYVEIPAGTFLLLPAKKLYADIKSASASVYILDSNNDADVSPEALLNEPPGARYEKLGSEKLDGRTTTKYRVTNDGSRNGTEATTVTLIWIDEKLGMPIRSETEVSDGNHHSKISIELRDIELQVDAKLFELPRGYKKVEESELRDWLNQILAGESRESQKP